MSIEFKLPELGENIESGDIVNILVEEGETIEPNQGVFEVETDKAVVEIPCSDGGKISKIHVAKGDTVDVGQTLLTIEPGDDEDDEEVADEQQADEAEQADTGSEEKAKQPAAAEGPPPSQEQPARPAEKQPSGKARASATAERGNGPLPAGPAARRVARELGVDLHRIQGSGGRGRITVEDVEAAAAGGGAPGGGAAAPVGVPEAVTPPGSQEQDNYGTVYRDKISQIRRTIARQMAKSASTIPHVTNFDDADVTDLEQLRKGVPKGYLGEDVKLTPMPFVMRAVAVALRHHPMLNASLDEENDQIIYKGYVNLGVAVDTPRGLVVPVIRDIDQMGIAQIAREVGSLARRARDAQFAIEELRGGTFTISNLGAVGGTYSTPIINHPEVAILLLGRSRWMPVMRDGSMTPRLMMPLSLSYDHRLVDGAAAGRFLNEVIDLLQSPGKLLLAG
jgi:pyruvate dehydrogenase E2 component (dihydrolipoamide acetyltransferase)